MKIKTSELEGPALDWSVAAVTGEHDDGEHAIIEIGLGRYSPSTDWSQGGPLIENHLIELHTNTGEQHGEHERWYAVVPTSLSGSRGAMGPTPLIAAMRALDFAKLGEMVDVPDELLEAAAERRE